MAVLAAPKLAPQKLAPPRGSALLPVPGGRSFPYVGSMLSYMRDPVASFRRRYTAYGPVSWTNGLGTTMVTVLGPDAVGQVLANTEKTIANGPGWGFFIGPFFHRGLMLLDFAEHLHHRRILQQAFTQQRLRGYLDAMNPMIDAGLSGWAPKPGFLAYPAARDLTLDIATELFMGGTDYDAQKARVNKAFVDTVRAGTALVRTPVPGGRWKAGLDGRKVLESFLYQRIAGHRAGSAGDLFTALCHAETEDGHTFTDTDVVNHMIFLLMAAHDTTTITLASMISYLGQAQDWQDRCREEAFAIDSPRLGFDDIDRCTSVELAMKEANRLISPVPSMGRRTVADTEIVGHYVPAGTQLQVGLHFTHHMAELWPEPERFDPGRFAEDRREDKVHRYAWTPFGGGVHKCIGLHFAGMQVKAVMHQLLRSYRWTVPAEYTAPIDYTSLPVPRDGMPVHLERL